MKYITMRLITRNKHLRNKIQTLKNYIIILPSFGALPLSQSPCGAWAVPTAGGEASLRASLVKTNRIPTKPSPWDILYKLSANITNSC